MEEIKPIENIVKVLKNIINQNGPKYITSKPFQVYEKLLESKDVDKRTAVALLDVFISEIIPCNDEKLLSNLL